MSTAFSTNKTASLIEKMERCQSLGFDYRHRATVEVKRCNVCKGNKTQVVAIRDRYGFDVQCLECTNCQTAWLSPRMPEEAYLDFYANWYRRLLTAWYGREFSAESIEGDQTVYAKAVCDTLAQKMGNRQGQSVLDVGGSTGITAQAMADILGLVPTVLDPCDSELERAALRGFRTIHGCIESTGVFEKFDVITMFQTIEHLLDPRSALTKLKCLLKLGGLLIFDANQWQMQKSHRPIEMFVKIDHLYYFTDYSVRWLIESCELRLVTKFCAVGNKVHYVCQA